MNHLCSSQWGISVTPSNEPPTHETPGITALLTKVCNGWVQKRNLHDVLGAIPYFGTVVTEKCQLPGGPQDMREPCPQLWGAVPGKSLVHLFPNRISSLHREGFRTTGNYRDHLVQSLQSSRCGQSTQSLLIQ